MYCWTIREEQKLQILVCQKLIHEYVPLSIVGVPYNNREWWGVREAKGVYLGGYKLLIIHLSK